MNKLLRRVVFGTIAFGLLSGCNDQNQTDSKPAQTATTAAAPITAPTDSKDTAAWRKYFTDVLTRNMDGLTTTMPYGYFVPAGEDDAMIEQRKNQLDKVKGTVGQGVLPGNMLAFGGPDSKTTADLVVAAFAGAQANTLKNVRLLFIGKPEDSERVKTAATPTGVDYRFVEMK